MSSDQKEERPTTSGRPTVLDIHGYKVGKTLGHGSYATVKEAYSSRHKCKVAIKIISKRRAPGDYLDKFLPREIDVVKLLKHPNLVVFLQSIETNNRVYLIMENASGGDLLEVIRAEKVIKEKQAGIWFEQLVEGIAYCHSRGVVHRDLKCENLLLDEYRNLKVTDFGFARANMKPKGSEFTLSETYCGSYAYAAPEILTGTPYAPQHADVWSMGVILYVLVFGRLPFDDSNHKKLLKQVHKGPTFPEGRDVTMELRDLIKKILQKSEIRFRIPDIKAHSWYRKIEPVTISVEQSFLHQLRAKRNSTSEPATKPSTPTDKGGGGNAAKAGETSAPAGSSSKTGDKGASTEQPEASGEQTTKQISATNKEKFTSATECRDCQPPASEPASSEPAPEEVQ